MLIVMKQTATADEVAAVVERIESVGARAHVSPGDELTLIGAIGDRDHVARLGLEGHAGVEQVVPILKPYKLASSQLRAGAGRRSRSAGARSAATTSR
jgi:3-deoxy-7-phosphoheptulonate synthase